MYSGDVGVAYKLVGSRQGADRLNQVRSARGTQPLPSALLAIAAACCIRRIGEASAPIFDGKLRFADGAKRA